MFEFVGSYYPQLAAAVAILFMAVLGFASVEEAVMRRRSDQPQHRLGLSADAVETAAPLTAHVAGVPGPGESPPKEAPDDEVIVVEVVTIYTR